MATAVVVELKALLRGGESEEIEGGGGRKEEDIERYGGSRVCFFL